MSSTTDLQDEIEAECNMAYEKKPKNSKYDMLDEW